MGELLNKGYSLFWFFIDILATKSTFLSNKYYNYIGPYYENEIKQFNLLNEKKILHIGSGPYPLTAIKYSELKNTQIQCIDSNRIAVNIAEKYLKKKKYDNKIKIKHINGINVNPKDYDLIIISGCTIEKNSVIKNIVKNSKKDTKIIIRHSRIDINSFKKFIKKQKNIIIKKEIICKTKKLEGWNSFYLLKK